MSSFVNGRRVFAGLILAFASLGVYERFADSPQIVKANASARVPFLASKFAGRDTVTDAIRSDSAVLTRISVKNDADRKAAARIGKIVQDYGSFILVAKNREIEAKGYGLEEQTVETTVNLPGARFDPVKQPPQGSLRLGAATTAPGAGYYILQFGGTATDEWLKSVSDAGVEVLQYVSHQAYFVYADSEAIARVANHSRVRWIGQYTAEQKLSGAFRSQVESAAKGSDLDRGVSPIALTKKGAALFDVAVFARADLDKVAAMLQDDFGRGYFRTTRLQHNFFNLVRLELSLDEIDKVAAIPDVAGIEAVIPSRNEDARSAHILAGNYLNQTTLSQTEYNPFLQFGTDGRGVTVSVVDDGVGIPGDGEFYIHLLNAVQGPLHGAPSGAVGHGHLNASIIAGSADPPAPLGSDFYNYGIGVAPGAHIVNIPRNRAGYTGNDATVYDDSVSTAGPNGVHATISNNSWGNGTNNNAYGFAVEGMFDGFVQDASLDPGVDPVTLIFSAGNEGPSGLTRPKVAKNVISVGNSEGLRSTLAGTAADNMDDLAADSSRGPAADGRIKPDLVAPGTAITGGRSGPNTLSGNIDSFHRWSSGTSHSAAHISGAAALFSSLYGQSTGERVTPSLIKAALINSTVDLNGQGTSEAIPNGNEGWGRPNLKTVLTPGVNVKYVNETTEFANTGQSSTIDGSVADGSKPVRVTLVWTDPPGTTDPALVNNLDLEVILGGVSYKGNAFSNGVSVPGGAADPRNNVESVFLPAGNQAGTDLSVKVTATALNGDGILNNGDPTDQKYSLIIYNWSGTIGSGFYRMEGRVISANSRGVGMAKVKITDGQGTLREVRTNPLGYFLFTNVPGGQTYTVTIGAKRYLFVPRNETVTGNLTGLVFRAEPGAP
jgi:hypothetical protein